MKQINWALPIVFFLMDMDTEKEMPKTRRPARFITELNKNTDDPLVHRYAIITLCGETEHIFELNAYGFGYGNRCCVENISDEKVIQARIDAAVYQVKEEIVAGLQRLIEMIQLPE